MREYQSLSHVRWECKYHIVFVPKYRKKVLWPCPEKRDNELRVASEFIKELTFGLLRSFP